MVRVRALWIVDAARNDLVVVRYNSAATRGSSEAVSWLAKMAPIAKVNAENGWMPYSRPKACPDANAAILKIH